MWIFPLAAAVIAAILASMLALRVLRGGGPAEAAWAAALAMYATASVAMFLGVLSGWTTAEFRTYWLTGAILTVPYLALGEIYVLAKRTAGHVLFVALVFGTAFALTKIRTAAVHAAALRDQLPLGKDVFGSGTAAHRLPQLYSIPAYVVLVLGALWSAWRMRSAPELRRRATGTLAIAAGATVVAIGSGIGAGFGVVWMFSVSLAAGIVLMMAGFVRASAR
ncbi:MAG: hypothetical protein ABR600_11170 [Actinomycetota bacterium]